MEKDIFNRMWDEEVEKAPNIGMPELFSKLRVRIKAEYGESETAKLLYSNVNSEEAEYYDAHSCSAEADASGVCQVCGALVYMSPAYCDAYGCDPPERHTRYNPFTDCFEDIDD